MEGIPIGIGREVSAFAAPAGDGVHYPCDQPPDTAFALGSSGGAAEVLRSNDIGGEHRPGLGDLDVPLLENGFAVFAGDRRSPMLPGQLVGGVDAGRGEITSYRHSGDWAF